GELPIKDYGINQKFIESLKTVVPAPRANTYVLNVVSLEVTDGKVTLHTNYSNMRSLFALRRWIPELSEDSPERALILQNVLPIGGEMMLESIDGKILIEERGKVEVSGKYNPAPAGGCETRNWKVFPEPFRSIKGEAWEETGLLPGDYSPVGLIGVARDFTDGYNPTFVYHAVVKLPLAEIIAKADSIAPEAGEHQRLFGVETTASKLLDFCTENVQKIVGNGLGGIIVFGGYKFGDSWVQEAIQELERHDWEINDYGKRFPK
ncbi:MAG: hypothetical protein AABX04_02635, partial [Nanoarchaeota archaeon]